MLQIFIDLLLTIASTVWDVLPIVIVIFGFQRLVLGKPIANRKKILTGFVLVLLGLAFFLEGLEAALFPLGRLMAQQLTDPVFIAGDDIGRVLEWWDYQWVYLFAFAVGFATTIAEPSLLAVAIKAKPGICRQYRYLGSAYRGSYRCCHRHRPGCLPHYHRHPALLVHYFGIRIRVDTNHVCTAHDYRAGLRLRRRYYIDSDGPTGRGPRPRPRQYRAGA